MTPDQIYAGDRIEYMNARRAAKPASGGTNYARPRRKSDETMRDAGLDAFDVIRDKAWAAIANQRAIVREFRNSLAAGPTAADLIPF